MCELVLPKVTVILRGYETKQVLTVVEQLVGTKVNSKGYEYVTPARPEDCIGCLRAFSGKGITPRHLVDLLLGLETAPILQPLDEYHAHARYTENVLTEELVAAGGCAGCPGRAANRG